MEGGGQEMPPPTPTPSPMSLLEAVPEGTRHGYKIEDLLRRCQNEGPGKTQAGPGVIVGCGIAGVLLGA